jgi:predicted metalloprotease with PDZ domain
MRTIAALIVALVVTLIAFPAAANMPPPEPFKLGIAGKLNPDGLIITAVEKGSKADENGLRVGDVILGADRIYAKSMSLDELKKLTEGLHVWRAELVILRGGRDIILVEIRA